MTKVSLETLGQYQVLISYVGVYRCESLRGIMLIDCGGVGVLQWTTIPSNTKGFVTSQARYNVVGDKCNG